MGFGISYTCEHVDYPGPVSMRIEIRPDRQWTTINWSMGQESRDQQPKLRVEQSDAPAASFGPVDDLGQMAAGDRDRSVIIK